MKSERSYAKESARHIDFPEAFRDLTKELAAAYSVSPDIYTQPASISRLENGISINQAGEFLNHVYYDQDKAKSIIDDFAKTHKPVRFYSGKDTPIGLGVNISSEELLNLEPDSKATGRSRTIAVLAQRAARLESLLTADGIPDAYASAQSQTRKAIKLVEKAANLAYDWHTSWGTLNVDNALSEAGGGITKKKVARAAMAGVFALAGCNITVAPFIPIADSTPVVSTPTSTEVVPAMTETLVFTSTATLKPTQTETAVPTGTATPEAYDWEFVSQKTDEEIFNVVGVPDPAEYSLDVEISPYKILRNEGGQSYALFKDSEGIVVLAENIENRVVEHAVYTEYEGGIPILLLTDQEVVEKDGGWFQLNSEYPASEAQERLAHAFNRAVSMRWWGVNHKEAGSGPSGFKDWVGEIPGFSPTLFHYLTKGERTQISDYIMQKFLQTLGEARLNQSPLLVELADRNRTEFDVANETLVIRFVRSGDISWKPIFEHYMDPSHREVTTEKNGKFTILSLSQPSFSPYREPRPVGGTVTHFFRYFFGASYFYQGTSINVRRLNEDDMTGPIFEDLCKLESIPDIILYYYDKIYPSMSYGETLATSAGPTNTCSVVFSK